MSETAPKMRSDLEFFPLQHDGRQLVLIRDHLGLVQEGKAISAPLYQIMVMLDGTRSLRHLQIEFMRQKGGVLVGQDEVERILAHLDESFLLDSVRFRAARDRVVSDFASKRVRPCSHCGRVYPDNPSELRQMLEDIMVAEPLTYKPEGVVRAIIAPHIDLSAGYKAYSGAYQMLRHVKPSRVVVLGVGHHMANGLFSLTDKDFETPLGVIKGEPSVNDRLRDRGGEAIAANDFVHRSEHSIEFQTLFLLHLLEEGTFTILPILCGSLHTILAEYNREAYLEKTGPFLEELRDILAEANGESLLVAGVDLSHIGPKFGHEMPAEYLKKQAEAHDRKLLQHLSNLDADRFWKESREVKDRFNVCGFSALACMLEILPPCKGEILHYHLWQEEATRSSVSFASVVFNS